MRKLANMEASGNCSSGSKTHTMDESEDSELCLLRQSQHSIAGQKAASRYTVGFAKCFGYSFSMKFLKSSYLSQRRDSYKILQRDGGRGEERRRYRKWDKMRSRLSNFIQIDRELEVTGVRRVRQVLYYA